MEPKKGLRCSEDVSRTLCLGKCCQLAAFSQMQGGAASSSESRSSYGWRCVVFVPGCCLDWSRHQSRERTMLETSQTYKRQPSPPSSESREVLTSCSFKGTAGGAPGRRSAEDTEPGGRGGLRTVGQSQTPRNAIEDPQSKVSGIAGLGFGWRLPGKAPPLRLQTSLLDDCGPAKS